MSVSVSVHLSDGHKSIEERKGTRETDNMSEEGCLWCDLNCYKLRIPVYAQIYEAHISHSVPLTVGPLVENGLSKTIYLQYKII